MRHSQQKSKGFTLIELSIVLVVIGLLVGGVLVGKDLIKAAELRAVISQEQRFATAINTFQEKYSSLPGDMRNATDYWGTQDPNPATCITTPSTTTATCNGNGNGKIEQTASDSSNEIFRFWQHLGNAGLIEGRFDGITHGPNTYSMTKENSPGGKIDNTLWWADTLIGTTFSFSAAFRGNYENFLFFGGAVENYVPVRNIFRPADLLNIDSKIDDGKPATGRIVPYAVNGLSKCTTTIANDIDNLAAEYLLTSNDIKCSIIFRQAF